jgi:glutathione gamma-glutamylcysteinyltransferase
MDPNVRWRGGWRWYGDESMLLERCCLEEERVKREGISIEMFGGLARCQGVDVVLKRPSLDVVSPYLELPSEKRFNANADNIQSCSIDVFRKDIITAVCNPPRTEWDEDAEHIVLEQSSNKRFFIVTSFSRSSLRQTGEGHFSPIAAYDPTTDSCLVMDVARFKYAPYWVSVQDLFDAMIPLDAMTEKSRGWILMYPPHAVHKGNAKAKTVGEQEGKRPAACVPMAGSGTPLCPVEKIKVGYCSVDKSRS